VREREGRDCQVEKRVTLPMLRKTPSNQSNLPLGATAHYKFTHSTFGTTRGEKRKTGDGATCTIDETRPIDNFSSKFFF